MAIRIKAAQRLQAYQLLVALKAVARNGTDDNKNLLHEMQNLLRRTMPPELRRDIEEFIKELEQEINEAHKN